MREDAVSAELATGAGKQVLRIFRQDVRIDPMTTPTLHTARGYYYRLLNGSPAIVARG
jgi:hypothetical protein